MDRSFTSFGQLSQHLAKLQEFALPAVKAGMHASATKLQREVKEDLGQYQASASPFPAWATLAPGTIRDRVRLGYDPDRPLERTEELRASYEVSADGDSVGVGSRLDRALALEVGNPARNLPARSILGRAFRASEAASFELCSSVIFNYLARLL